MQTEETEIADESVDLQIVPRADASDIFEGYRRKSVALIAVAEKLEITNAEEFLSLAPVARTTRLSLREIRLAMEEKRVELTEFHLKEKRRIDGIANEVIKHCKQLEERLKKLETWDDDRREAELQRVTAERREQLLAVGGMIPEHVGSIPQEQFEATLQDAKDLKAIREKRAADEEAARVRQEQERQAEIERQRVENERLKAEAAAKDEELRKEREERAAVEQKAAEERRIAAEEQRRQIELQQKEQQERDRQAQAERDRLKAEQKAAEDRATEAERQRQLSEAKQRETERQQQAALDLVNREAEERRQRELKDQQDRMRAESAKAVRDAEERAGRQRQAEADAEADRQAREQAEERKRKATLSDGQKLTDYLKTVTALEYPRLAPQRQVQFMALRETLLRGLEDMAKKLS